MTAPQDEFDERTMNRQEILDATGAPVVVFDKVSLAFDDKVILREVSFTLIKGHTKIILGASGAGKSTILKLITGLLRPDAGVIWVNGERVEDILGFIGLTEHVDKMPSELSGGQRRRVAIARAMAAKPRVLLYDEPTTGLDPITATTVDEEIVKLRDLEGVSSIVVTHQLRDAFFIAGHRAVRNGAVAIEVASEEKSEEAEFIMLRDGHIVFEGPAGDLKRSTDPYLKTFLS